MGIFIKLLAENSKLKLTCGNETLDHNEILDLFSLGSQKIHRIVSFCIDFKFKILKNAFFKLWNILLQAATENGCTLIQLNHLKFHRLLGDMKTVVLDAEKANWVVTINYGQNKVELYKNIDCNITDGSILVEIRKYLVEKGKHQH